LSTPYRKRGFFYANWEHGGPGWHRVRVPATECPRISREFLEEDRRHQKGDFEMEYMCEFMEDGNSVFNRDLVMKALDPTVEPFDFSGIGTWR
jgi:hypothetical protein